MSIIRDLILKNRSYRRFDQSARVERETLRELVELARRTLSERCVRGITANREVCRRMVEHSIGLVTALNPYIGYEKSSEIANLALASGRSVYEIILEKGYLSKTELDEILSPENMTRPRLRSHGK